MHMTHIRANKENVEEEEEAPATEITRKNQQNENM